VTAPTHIVFGLNTALAAITFGATLPSAISLLALIIGSLAPDIDSPRSTISKPGQLFSKFLPRLITDLMNVFGLLFSLGYASHIVADFCTKGGIAIFSPVYHKTIRWSPVKTGSIWEFFICSILLIVLLTAGFEYLPLNLEGIIDAIPD